RGLGRLLEAFARAIEFPAVVRTANALLVDPAVGQRSGSVRAVLADQAVVAFFIAEDNQLFVENFHRADRFFLGELRRRRDRMPVPAQQLAAGRAAADLSEQFVFLGSEHAL